MYRPQMKEILLPSQLATFQRFASFTDNGNGTGALHLTPADSDIGTYQGIVIRAQDENGASSTQTIAITVTNKDITSIYVNFNQVLPVASPWNSFQQHRYRR